MTNDVWLSTAAAPAVWYIIGISSSFSADDDEIPSRTNQPPSSTAMAFDNAPGEK